MQFSREQKKKWFTHPSGAQYLIGYVPPESRTSIIEKVSAQIKDGEAQMVEFNTAILMHCLYDWKNVFDYEGKLLSFSKEAIFYLYSQDFSAEFYDHTIWIQERAAQRFEFDNVEQVLKNLQAPSNGAAHIHEQPLHIA